MEVKWADLTKQAGSFFQIFTKNQRKHSRVKSFSLMKLLASDTIPQGHISNLVNISEGGLQFRSKYKLLPGAVLKIAINVADFHHDIVTLARVKWVRKSDNPRSRSYRVGVVFLELKSQDKALIKRYVSGNNA